MKPIPIKDARRLLSMAREDDGRAEIGPWRSFEDVMDKADSDFIRVAREAFGPMVEYIAGVIEDDAKDGHGLVTESLAEYPVLAALASHYDRTKPEWRQK